jgi:hypothetical protein
MALESSKGNRNILNHRLILLVKDDDAPLRAGGRFGH